MPPKKHTPGKGNAHLDSVRKGHKSSMVLVFCSAAVLTHLHSAELVSNVNASPSSLFALISQTLLPSYLVSSFFTSFCELHLTHAVRLLTLISGRGKWQQGTGVPHTATVFGQEQSVLLSWLKHPDMEERLNAVSLNHSSCPSPLRLSPSTRSSWLPMCTHPSVMPTYFSLT